MLIVGMVQNCICGDKTAQLLNYAFRKINISSMVFENVVKNYREAIFYRTYLLINKYFVYVLKPGRNYFY